MTDFPITANDARIQYTATASQTVFPYDFPIFDQSHLAVTRVRAGVTTTLTITTDYTVSGVGVQAGGNVTLISGATVGDLITISRDVPAARATDYNEAGDFFATALNQDLDLLVMQDQQIIRDLDRSLRLAAEDTLTALNAIPTVSARAGQFLTFDSSGQPSVASGASDVPVSSAMAPVVAAISVSAGRDVFGLEIGSDVQAYDAALSSIASIAITADQLLYAIAADQYAATTITQFGRTLIDDANAAAARTTIGIPNHDLIAVDASGAVSVSRLVVDTITIDGTAIGTSSGSMVIAPSAGGQFGINVSRNGIIGEITNSGSPVAGGFAFNFTATAPDNNSEYFYRFADSVTARCIIYSDGDLQNHDNSYGAISDARLKHNIFKAKSQWDDVKALADELVNFTFISDGENATPMLGFIAQSAAEISPGLVQEVPHAELGTALSVQYSIAYLKGFGAVGEALKRIEELEARVTALEGQ